jgi:hypothetical protein
MAKLNADVKTIFRALYKNEPLTDYKRCQSFVYDLMNSKLITGYTNRQLAEATNCQSANFSIWRRSNSVMQTDSQFYRDTNRVQTWLNQHLETDAPKPLPADIEVWVALASAKDKPGRVFVPANSRVQDIPKLISEERTLGVMSELDVESLILGEETMEWTRLCSSYSFANPNLVLVHLSTE